MSTNVSPALMTTFRTVLGLIFSLIIVGALWALSLAGDAWTPKLGDSGVLSNHPAAHVKLKDLRFIHSDQNKFTEAVIGREALGQYTGAESADDRHIRVTRDDDGQWYIANVSTQRRLVITPAADSTEIYARPIQLQNGDRLHIGQSKLNVAIETGGKLILARSETGSGERYALVGKTDGLFRVLGRSAGQSEIRSSPACATPGFMDQRKLLRPTVKALMSEVAASELDYEVALLIGGQAYCSGSLGQTPILADPALPYDTARIALFNGNYYLMPGRSLALGVERATTPCGNGSLITFDNNCHQITGGPPNTEVEFTAGRTAYRVSTENIKTMNGKVSVNQLIFTPYLRTHRFFSVKRNRAGEAESYPPPGCFEAAGASGRNCRIQADNYIANWQRPGLNEAKGLKWQTLVKGLIVASGGMIGLIIGWVLLRLFVSLEALRWRRMGAATLYLAAFAVWAIKASVPIALVMAAGAGIASLILALWVFIRPSGTIAERLTEKIGGALNWVVIRVLIGCLTIGIAFVLLQIFLESRVAIYGALWAGIAVFGHLLVNLSDKAFRFQYRPSGQNTGQHWAIDAVRFLAFFVSLFSAYILFDQGRSGQLLTSEEALWLSVSLASLALGWSTGKYLHLRLGLVAGLIAIMCIGAATQMHMSVFSESSKYEVYWQNQFFGFSVLSVLLNGFRLIPTHWFGALSRINQFWSYALAAVSFAVLAALTIAQHAVGSEEGVAGIQPTEVNKVVFCVLIGLFGAFLLDQWRTGRNSVRQKQADMRNTQFESPQPSKSTPQFLPENGTSNGCLAKEWIRKSLLGRVLSWVFRAPVTLLRLLVWTIILMAFGVILLMPIASSDMSPVLLLLFVSMSVLAIGFVLFLAMGVFRILTKPPAGIYPRVRRTFRLRRQPISALATNITDMLVPAMAFIVPATVLVTLGVLGLSGAYGKQSVAESTYIDAPESLRTVFERIISYHDLQPTLTLKNGEKRMSGRPSYGRLAFQVEQARHSLRQATCGPRTDPLVRARPGTEVNSSAQRLNSFPIVNGFRSQICGQLGIRPYIPDLASERASPFSIPAVHDDFAAAYVIHAFGVDMGIVLAMAQIIFVLCMFGVGLGALTHLASPSHVSWERNFRRFVGITCVTLAFLTGFQFLLGWGNTYGLLPVMGQPMTFVSAGLSHILALGVGLLIFADLAIRLVEVKPVGPARQQS